MFHNLTKGLIEVLRSAVRRHVPPAASPSSRRRRHFTKAHTAARPPKASRASGAVPRAFPRKKAPRTPNQTARDLLDATPVVRFEAQPVTPPRRRQLLVRVRAASSSRNSAAPKVAAVEVAAVEGPSSSSSLPAAEVAASSSSPTRSSSSLPAAEVAASSLPAAEVAPPAAASPVELISGDLLDLDDPTP